MNSVQFSSKVSVRGKKSFRICNLKHKSVPEAGGDGDADGLEEANGDGLGSAPELCGNHDQLVKKR
jgi:hypothetical protein